MYLFFSQHFAQDDPDLYNGKIMHLLKHGTEHLEDPIYFVDEVMCNGQIKVSQFFYFFSSLCFEFDVTLLYRMFVDHLMMTKIT